MQAARSREISIIHLYSSRVHLLAAASALSNAPASDPQIIYIQPTLT